MRLLITGAAGMLGGDVVDAARAAGHTAIALSRGELDITDSSAVDESFARASADAVINCAAWTDVDGAESDPEGALAVNAVGAANVARAAHTSGAITVQISSDYVFDGAARSPYVESSPTAPLSEYGRSKLAGERAVTAIDERNLIVRSAWLFGAGGPSFVTTMLGLGAQRDEVTVVDDQTGCPTYTGHLAPALVELAARALAGQARGIYHVAGTGQCSWYDFAVEIFSQSDLACEVRRGRSAELGRPAPRPAHSVLTSERGGPQLAHWREGLAEYLALAGKRRPPSNAR